MIEPFYRHGPLIHSRYFAELKDPAIVFDGHQWHLYGTGVLSKDRYDLWDGEIFHATAKTLEGPWHENRPAFVSVRGECVAAPEVIFERGVFHMFIQTGCFELGGAIDHLFSYNGDRFEQYTKVLPPIPHSPEAGVYDQSPDTIKGDKYLVYAAMSVAHQPNIHLAKSRDGSWNHFERLGAILKQEDVVCHNRLSDEDYEWGLEGPQLLELPNGQVLLIAVCYLADKPRGDKQRLFFAKADSVTGPYKFLNTAIEPLKGQWDSGENGHGTGVIQGDILHLFYQGRPENGIWNIGHAKFKIEDLEKE
jgi:hypothetical protein